MTLSGTHETQVSEGGEADLHKHLVGCKKNPGHKQFIPVNDFNINHLPEGNHDNLLVEYIKAVADLTVRVAVKMTSTERPEFWPNTKQPYPFYDKRGSDVMRVGTGMVRYVNIEYNKGTCPCHKCQHSDTPSKVWGKVRMNTATHVVFDDLEARHTTCRLFFDRQDSPLVTLDGWTVREADIEEDRCWLDCVTCDVDLINKLVKMEDHWYDLWKKVNNKYRSCGVKLTLIVSHPHGCPKQISVGHWIDRYEVSGDRTKYTYTTCTCPGSSGAYVHPLGYGGGLLYDHVHSGVNSEGRNFSGAGWD